MEKIKSPFTPSQELKALIKGLGVGIVIIDKDMKVLWANRNPASAALAGWHKYVKGSYCYDILNKGRGPCKGCPSETAFKTGDVERSRIYAGNTNGGGKYIELTASPVLDKKGDVVAVAEIYCDVTPNVEVENQLKEHRDRLQAVFDGIGDGISVIDRDFNIKRVNREILSIFKKKDFSDVLGRKCYEVYLQADKACDDCPAQRSFNDRAKGQLSKVWGGRFKEKRVFDISTFPILDSNGNVAQVIEYFRDNTGMLKLEEQILRYERLAGVGELAMGIAHELRNPIGNINASVQFCLDKYAVDKKLKRHLRVILRNSESANRIIKDLLDFAKPDDIVLKAGSVSKVLERACALVKTRCLKQRVRLYKKWPQRLPMVMVDARRLAGAFLNLILNALDAMPEGGSMIVASYLNKQAKELVVTFTDTGDGISAENIPNVFDPFFSTKKSGVGLGLSIAHHIITHHNGAILINSKQGIGTEVTVSFPASYDLSGC